MKSPLLLVALLFLAPVFNGCRSRASHDALGLATGRVLRYGLVVDGLPGAGYGRWGEPGEVIYVEEPLHSARVLRATDAIDLYGRVAVEIALDAEGSKEMRLFTAAHTGRTLAVLVGDHILASALIGAPLSGNLLLPLRGPAEQQMGSILGALQPR